MNLLNAQAHHSEWQCMQRRLRNTLKETNLTADIVSSWVALPFSHP